MPRWRCLFGLEERKQNEKKKNDNHSIGHFLVGWGVIRAVCLLELSISCTFLFFLFSFCTLSLSSLWTSRGHRCHPFSSPVLAFNFYRA